ncbi:chlorophyll a/b-binding protein domain-containing protein [Tribonema minus]|uniref:Chlorophyll a/b-binding protein domain-containing protein n=1 Tax=Tribonema minus TaxID=303371 RepID=A0A835Z4D2_9STRA|nr:chlorophyll a/b-binding protein domain-containing protein [Tribonema minus]
MSKSLPFLVKPKQLDGWVGNAEFDPFSLSELLPMAFVRESELKHGRIAMLAVVGFVVSELIHIPGEAYQASNPVDAVNMVGAQPMLQIFAFCGFLESVFHKGKMTMMDMHADGQTPGDFGFDPLNVSKDPAKLAQYQLSEIKNGRLAMMAISGLIHQSIITGHGVPFN